MAQIDIAMNQPIGSPIGKVQRFKIGEALFCPLQRRITLDGKGHQLEPRISKLLSVLIVSDVPVSRESLLDDIWGKDGSDEALTQAISKLRRALGDTARPYRIIETLPKQGYRLSAPVEPEFLETDARHELRTSPSIKGLLETLPLPLNFIRGLVVGASVVLVGTVAVFGLIGPRSSEIEIECPTNASGEECLAMLQLAVGHE